MNAEVDKINNLLGEIGRREQIDRLRLSADGGTGIAYANGVRVYFEHVPDRSMLVVFTPFLDLPDGKEKRLALLEELLQSNFLKAACCNGELAISKQTEQAIYQIALGVASLDLMLLDQTINDVLAGRAALLSHFEKSLSRKPGSGPSFQRATAAFFRNN